MTAFDNIKTNNWPATSNEFEDYLVLELPLNDAAALTESRRDIVVSDKVLHQKVALTNNSTISVATGTVYSTQGTLTGSGWGAGHEISSAFRQGYVLYGVPQASGSGAFAAGNTAWRYTFPSPITVNNNVNIYFWRNGGNIKVNAGETDEQTDSTSSGYTTWTIPASDVGVLKNVELYTDGNTGPYWSGIDVDGVQLYDAPGGPKKHYDNNAIFNGSRRINTGGNLVFGKGDFTVECWAYPDSASGEEGVFQVSADSVGLATTQSNTVTLQKNSGVWRAYANDTSTAFSTSVVAGQWVHLALVRRSGTMSLYVNGVADSTTISDSRNYTGKYINVGGYYDGNYLWTGSIQDLRVYNGVAKYTANFTPPGAILG